MTLSNGIGWSPEGDRMYYVDSGSGGVDVFDFEPESGSVANRRRLIDVPADDGVPDGLTVDAEGGIWLAIWGGGEVRRYAPGETRAERTVTVPASHATACALGGDDGRTLLITSAAGYLEPAEREAEPLAGGLFATRVEVPAKPATKFAGP